MVAQFIIQALLLPLVLIPGDGDKAVGFENTMTLFACVGIVFFLITFITTKERVLTCSAQSSTIRQDIGDLLKNRPWGDYAGADSIGIYYAGAERWYVYFLLRKLS